MKQTGWQSCIFVLVGLAFVVFVIQEIYAQKTVQFHPFYEVLTKPAGIRAHLLMYPEKVPAQEATGQVFLEISVNMDGSVRDVTVLEGKHLFREATMNTIKQFRFKSVQYEFRPIAAWITPHLINFDLAQSVAIPKPSISEIWITSRGQLLLDTEKPILMENLAVELKHLKHEKDTRAVVVILEEGVSFEVWQQVKKMAAAEQVIVGLAMTPEVKIWKEKITGRIFLNVKVANDGSVSDVIVLGGGITSDDWQNQTNQ